ncbi:MAG TPA: glycerophosphoryl diester phosphodiesterase membrane domain-containing protein [Terriglobales bacterium]|nr:glycerophosphoryl diester phosphodiesterase membrane domain-containing protein [Terriglobales bacterium]
MPASLRPLTTGQLLDRTFQTYRQNFVLFVGISAFPITCMLVLQIAILMVTRNLERSPIIAGLITLGLALAMMVVNIVATAISTGATTFGVSDINLDKPTSISACFSRVRGRIGSIAYASFGFGLIVGLGLILLIAPGVYWAGKYGLAVPSVVLENLTGSQSFDRSAQLTKNSIGRIVVIYFLTLILTLSVSLGVGMLVTATAPNLAKSAGTLTAAIFNQVVSSIISVLILPIMSIALTLAYYDQRVRKEAFDIENLMNLLGEPKPAAAQAAGASS